MRCGRCDRVVRGIYDRSTRSWRHLDLMRVRCTLRAEVRRVDCPDCGVVAERVPWARPGSRFTRSFEDTCVWLVRAAPKVVVAQLGLPRLCGDPHRRGRPNEVPGMEPAESASYIAHHLALAGRSDPLFSDAATALLHQASRRVPRLLNTLATQALVAAYAERKAIVDESSARAAVAEVTAE